MRGECRGSVRCRPERPTKKLPANIDGEAVLRGVLDSGWTLGDSNS
jgi:hypothetical protein